MSLRDELVENERAASDPLVRVIFFDDGGARLAERAEHERDGFVEGAQARFDWADGARGGAAVRLVGALSLPDVLGGHLLGALLNHGHDLPCASSCSLHGLGAYQVGLKCAHLSSRRYLGYR